MKPAALSLALLVFIAPARGDNWPAWRGADGTGISADASSYATEWDGKTGKNILWKSALPAPGNSSPIVWENYVFLTISLDKDGHRRALMAFDRNTGENLWKTEIEFPDEEPTHKTNPHCAATPVTDGESVYVSFGSAGAAAFNFKGEIRWRRDLGAYHHIWGNASSPILYQDTVIYFGSPGPLVTLTALDKKSGEIRWQKPLTDAQGKDPDHWKGSWATPLLWKNGDRDELLLPLPQKLASFDPKSGDLFWHCSGMTDLAYSDALVADGIVVGMSGYQGTAFALKVPPPEKASGDLTENRLWFTKKNPQRIGSGVVIGDHIFMVNEPGVAQCIDIRTGEVAWEDRIGKATWSSLIQIGGNLFSTDTTGTTHVFKSDPTGLKHVATNPLENTERTTATPAFSNGQIFIRTHNNLYAIATKPPQ